ncbi:MAG: hypothetical protein KAX37_00825 [Opitutaceae bacterium]|nr:hypothetical protein [Opitutaceae bacterium]
MGASILVASGLAFGASHPAWGADVDFLLKLADREHVEPVSSELMGFNIVYCHERDAVWDNGRGIVPGLLAELNTQVLRYPGGTVNTFFHWKEPTGQGWVDSWSAEYSPAKNLPPSATMSLDEYLDLVGRRRLVALVGINLSSGLRFPARHDEAMAEAADLVRHCLARGVSGAYYYLDNEHYRSDANFNSSPEAYADEFVRYAKEIRFMDPKARLIANLHSGSNENGWDSVRRVIRRAGAWIDLVDLHFYWRHNDTSFAAWTMEPHMTHQRGRPYREQRAFYRDMFAREGFPDIDVVSLEWNISASGKNPQPTQSEAALMVSEQFIQFIQSGMKLACYWPLSMPGSYKWQYRCLLNSGRGYSPNKVFGMFRQFADIGGQFPMASEVVGKSNGEWLTHLALRSDDHRTVTLFLVNKNQQNESSSIAVNDTAIHSGCEVRAVGFEAGDNSGEILHVHPIPISVTEGRVSLSMPKNSFAKVVISKLLSDGRQ